MASEMKECLFRVRWSDEDGKWMGQCHQHMELFHLSDDPVEAIQGIVEKVKAAQAVGSSPEVGSIFKQMDDMLVGAPGPFGRTKS